MFAFCIHSFLIIWTDFCVLTWCGQVACAVLPFPEHDGYSESAPSKQRDSATELQQKTERWYQVHPGQLHRDYQNSKGAQIHCFLIVMRITLSLPFSVFYLSVISNGKHGSPQISQPFIFANGVITLLSPCLLLARFVTCPPYMSFVLFSHQFLSPDRGWDTGFSSNSSRAGPLWNACQGSQHCKYQCDVCTLFLSKLFGVSCSFYSEGQLIPYIP